MTTLIDDAGAADKAAADKAAADAAANTPEAKAAAEKAASEKAAADAAANTPEAKAAAEKAAAEKAGAVPDKYEFTAPAGVELDADAVGEFSGLAKELKLPQAQAQRVVDVGVKMRQKAEAAFTAQMTKIHSDWIESSKADKEYGGAAFDANLATAKLALQGEAPEFVKMLNETGLGNHPEMIRHLYRIGKTRKSDTTETGKHAQQAAGGFTYEKSNHT